MVALPRWLRVAGTETKRCLIVGAGRAGRTIARDLRDAPEFGLTPVGFLDDDRRRRLLGYPVCGALADLPTVALALDIDVVIVAIPALVPEVADRIAAEAASLGVAVRYVPSFLATIERDARLSDLRDVRVEALLGREERRVVRSDARAGIEGKVVLVSGAGGSIGSELCRQIRAFAPRELYVLDHDESNLHTLQMELDGRALLDGHDIVIADIRDAERIEQVFSEVRPDIVFHAAAHKHLPLLEQHPCEGVKTNVLGTKNLAEAAVHAGTRTFVLISTDKAADPVSILGATKRLAEIVLTLYAAEPTRFASVRFGNVLGSRGSLLSVFEEQVRRGGTVTITHPEVTRYFMTIEEAAGLVLEAGAMAEYGETFVLDMGEPIEIVQLAYRYAEQLHIRPDDLTIRFTGLRPGEKLHERLFGGTEDAIPTGHPRIWATRNPIAPPDLETSLDALFTYANANRSSEVRRWLQELVAEYEPEPAGEPAMAAPYPDGF